MKSTFLNNPNVGLLCLIDFGFQPEGIIYSTYPYNGLVTLIGLTILLYSLSGDYCRLPLTPEHSHNTSVNLSVRLTPDPTPYVPILTFLTIVCIFNFLR